MNYLRKKANTIVTLAFFGLLAWYFINNQEAFKELLRTPLWAVVALVVLKTLRIFASGLFTKFTVGAFDRKMGYGETNYLSVLTSIGNFFGPILGGASIRAVYLKKRHNFNYSTFISTLYGFYVVSFATNALIGLVALLAYYLQFGYTRSFYTVVFLFGGVLISMSLLILLPSKVIHKLVAFFRFLPSKIIKHINMMIEGWETLRTNKRLILKLALLNLAIFFLATLMSLIMYKLFVSEFSLSSVILYTAIGTLSLLVSFTPGAIGIKEAIYLFTIGVLSIDSTQLLQMATIDRTTTFILLFISFVVIKIGRYDKKIERLKEEK